MADDKKPEEAAEDHPKYQQAKKGVQDAGEIVTSAGDEPLSGILADITDGDKRKKK
jgi:hypothetical protein